MLRPAVLHPVVGTGSLEAAIRGDHQARGIRVQRLRDQFFAYARTVGVSCVNEIDAQFDCPAQDLDRFRSIGWLAPNPLSSDSHCPKSQAGDAKILSDCEFACLSGEAVTLAFLRIV